MSHKDHGRCLVCDDIAIGINFGVPTCMPCKAFFRRNALKLGTRDFLCQNDGDCLITYKHRRTCNCCRLAKCFRVGMKKTLILSDEQREARNKLVEVNRLKRGKMPNKQCTTWMQAPVLLRMSLHPLHCLSDYDQMILSNIFNLYESTCIVPKNTRFHDFPVVQYTSVHEYVNAFSPLVQTFIEYFKKIPEFGNLIIDDKIRLVKNHIYMIVNVNGPILFTTTPPNLVISWTNSLGIELCEHLVKHCRIIEQYTFDPIILKLVLIIFVLSSSNGRNIDLLDMDLICDDTLSIYAAQNIYVELLWKYIVSRSASERDAVKYFNKLMMFILYVHDLDFSIDTYIYSRKDEIQQMVPMMQSMWPISEDDINIMDIDIAQEITLT